MKIICLFIIVLAGRSSDAQGVPDYRYEHACRDFGVLYRIEDMNYDTGEQAQEWCQIEGGTLAEPKTTEEADCMIEWLRTKPGMDNVWIGFYEDGGEVTSRIDAAPSTALDNRWHEGEPNLDEERCLVIFRDPMVPAMFGEVYDEDCNTRFQPYICQIAIPGIPEGFENPCPGVHYKLETRAEIAGQAQMVCMGYYGGKLAEPRTPEEAACLTEWLRTKSVENHAWIGFYEDNFMITSAVNRMFSSAIDGLWSAGEPNSGPDRCILMYTDEERFGKLADEDCYSDTHQFVCEVLEG